MIDFPISGSGPTTHTAAQLGKLADEDASFRRTLVYRLQQALSRDVEMSSTAWALVRAIDADPTNSLRSSLNQLAPRAGRRSALQLAILEAWATDGLPVQPQQYDIIEHFSAKELTAQLPLSGSDPDNRLLKVLSRVTLVRIGDGDEAEVVLADGTTARYMGLQTDLTHETVEHLADIAIEIDPEYWCVRVLIGDQIRRIQSDRPVRRAVGLTFEPPDVSIA